LIGVILQTDVAQVAQSINNVWILIASFLVFFMQPGFALLEAGQVRVKNATNVTMKNVIDWSLGVIIYFVLGFGIALVTATITSSSDIVVLENFSYINDSGSWINWVFGAVFAMTAATIISGAVSGRMQFEAYIILVIVVVGLVYPVAQGLVWEGGLLHEDGYLGELLGTGYLDFAGGTVVHMLGGVAGLVAAWALGPRKARYDESGNPQHIPGHSLIFVMLGAFILAFGWYGFNVGTQTIYLSDGGFQAQALGQVAVVTTLGMGAGAVSSMFVTTLYGGAPNPTFTANGLLAGLVAVTGAAVHVTWWGGILLGTIGGAMAYPIYYYTLTQLKVDDVCSVFAVHGAAGALGAILLPLLAVSDGRWSPMAPEQFAMQVLGVLILAGWAAGVTALSLKLINHRIPIRVSEEAEEKGLDESEHKTSTYQDLGSD